MRRTPRIAALTAAAASATLLLAGCAASSTSNVTPTAVATPSAMVTSTTTSTGTQADITFAQLMIPHHQQAVLMADMAVQKATSPEVIELATQIKAAQDPEIQQMRGWLQQWGAQEPMGDMGGMDHGNMDMGGHGASVMMSDQDMNELANATGAEFDQMWLAMMIAHHEGAIEMANQVKTQSSNTDVISLADAIVAGQTAEIATMLGLLEQ